MTDPTHPPAIPSTAWSMDNAPNGHAARGATAGLPLERERQKRGPVMIPWEGCALIPEDALKEVPENATLRIRLCVSWDGEVVRFDRSPFALNVMTLAHIQKRWGPATYVAQLFNVDPDSASGGLKGKPLAERIYEIRPRGERDIGDEPWPVTIGAPEIPASMRDEYERREAMRDAARAAAAEAEENEAATAHQALQGLQTQQAMTAQASAYESPQVALSMQAPPPPPPSPLGGLAALVQGKSVEEVLALAGGALRLVREISGGGASAQPAAAGEAERLRQAHEERLQAAKEAHELRMAELKFQQEQTLAAMRGTATAAPVVDEASIRARIAAEMLAKEVESLKADLKEAKKAPPAPPPKQTSFLDELRTLSQTAEALGWSKKGATPSAPATPPPPSLMDQVTEFAFTPGGQAVLAMLTSKTTGVPIPEIPDPAKALPEGGGEPPPSAS